MIISYNENDKLQADLIWSILGNIKDKFYSEENIFKVIVSGNEKAINSAKLIETVYKIIIDSIRYCDYHRAVQYLVVYNSLCENFLNEDKIKDYAKEACKRFGDLPY